MEKIILVKLGGSLITDKEKPFTAKMDVIDNLTRQIKRATEEDPTIRLIIGNGGGSYPHYPAVKYKMSGEIKSEEQKIGFCEVQDAAAQLNRIIVRQLLNNGVKAISANPSSMIIAKNGKIKEFFIEPIIELLKLNIIPVLYGDIICDEKFGAKIFSTEQILSELALRMKKRKIEVSRIIHNGMTKGVLDNKGQLIEFIDEGKFKKMKQCFFKTKGYDVTGGMLHKVEESLNLAKNNIKTIIINGVFQEDLLKKAILGYDCKGTVIS